MILKRFLNLFNNKNITQLNDKFKETLIDMEQNCSNILEITSKLPDSEQKENLIKELTKQNEVILKSKKIKP